MSGEEHALEVMQVTFICQNSIVFTRKFLCQVQSAEFYIDVSKRIGFG